MPAALRRPATSVRRPSGDRHTYQPSASSGSLLAVADRRFGGSPAGDGWASSRKVEFEDSCCLHRRVRRHGFRRCDGVTGQPDQVRRGPADYFDSRPAPLLFCAGPLEDAPFRPGHSTAGRATRAQTPTHNVLTGTGLRVKDTAWSGTVGTAPSD